MNDGIRWRRFFVVVLADSHNPTLLNPDWLRSTGIVPATWKPESERTVVTPVFAQVRYAQPRLRVTVQPERLEVVAGWEDGVDEEVVGVVSRYVATLPHVPYRAVGVNYEATVAMAEPHCWVRDHLLRAERAYPDPTAISVELAWQSDSVKRTIALAGDEASAPAGEERALLIKTNCHREVTASGAERASQLAAFMSEVCKERVWAAETAIKILMGERRT
jgi:hypothetical protein